MRNKTIIDKYYETGILILPAFIISSVSNFLLMIACLSYSIFKYDLGMFLFFLLIFICSLFSYLYLFIVEDKLKDRINGVKTLLELLLNDIKLDKRG